MLSGALIVNVKDDIFKRYEKLVIFKIITKSLRILLDLEVMVKFTKLSFFKLMN